MTPPGPREKVSATGLWSKRRGDSAPRRGSLPGEPTPLSCSSEGSIRSVEAVQQAPIVFVNASGQERVLYSLDYNDKRVQFSRLQPGQATTQNTYLTHPWLMADSSNTCQGIYLSAPGGGVRVTLC